MPPLYPKMRERPMEFRMNYDAPLAKGLVFAGLGGRGCVGSMVYPDSSLYGNHGRLINMDAAIDWVWSPELGRWATQHDTSSVNCVDFGHVEAWEFADTSFTVAIFALYRSLSSGWVRVFMQLEAESFPYPGWAIQGGGQLWFEVYDVNGNTAAVSTSAPALYQWTSVVGVFQRGGQVRLYLNGLLKSAINASAIGSLKNSKRARLANYDPGSSTQNFDGLLADACLWSRALTPPEISALADRSNVDLRVGGVPLILPPRRRYWPVVSEQAVPKMVPWHLFQQVGA